MIVVLRNLVEKVLEMVYKDCSMTNIDFNYAFIQF